MKAEAFHAQKCVIELRPLADIFVGKAHTKSDDFDERLVETFTVLEDLDRMRYSLLAVIKGRSTFVPTALNKFFTNMIGSPLPQRDLFPRRVTRPLWV